MKPFLTQRPYENKRKARFGPRAGQCADPCSVSLSMDHCHAVSVKGASQYISVSNVFSLCFLQGPFLGLTHFHINFRIGLLISTKKKVGGLLDCNEEGAAGRGIRGETRGAWKLMFSQASIISTKPGKCKTHQAFGGESILEA